MRTATPICQKNVAYSHPLWQLLDNFGKIALSLLQKALITADILGKCLPPHLN
jgi:hypothetical protein